MERIRRLLSKTNTYHRLSDKSSLTSFGNLVSWHRMSTDPPKKSSSIFFERLGQCINTLKEDIADNIERRRQLHTNQVHFTNRSNATEDLLVIEKKPPTPPEARLRQASDDDSINNERSFSFSQFTPNFGKKLTNEPSGEGARSTSSMDLFSSENSEHAKDMLMSNIRQEIKRYRARAISESGSDDLVTNKTDHHPTSTFAKPDPRKPTTLLAGPKFRAHTTPAVYDLKRDTIYPASFAVGLLSIIIIFWKPISPLFSGYILGFVTAAAIAYVIIRIYLNVKTDPNIAHEWIDFPELESVLHEKDKQTSLHTCCEIVFGRYDVDRDADFIRYSGVIRLNHQRLIVQLPTKLKSEEKKEKEILFVGFREYLLKETKLVLVPEATLNRKKYWLNEYPIVLENIQISNKQIINKQSYDKSKFDTDEFFNNSQTTLSLFFETGPDKEEWFHRLSLALRQTPEEIPSPTPIAHSVSDTQLSTATARTSLENRVQMKSVENMGPPYADTTPTEKSETEVLRSQVNEADIISDMTHARTAGAVQETRPDVVEKDADSTPRTSSLKKKVRKEEENLERLLSSPDCLDEAAITLNFLTRRLLCDVFDEALFKDLLKEKIELKLKEMAVSVLDDLRVETIDMGKTFPVILKVEPMQWNTKGIWFKLFLYYRGSFKITIKTRIVLQRLLNYNPLSEQPMHYQHQTAQMMHKDEEHDELVLRQKFSIKEPELPENIAARRIGTLLSKVAANPHVQRFAALKPVAGVIEKLSNAEIGVNIELTNISGTMTINIPPPPSDRIWIGFAEMPDLNLKVTPVFGDSKYSYALIHDFLEARIRDEIKRLLVLPAMDDQLLPFFRDWVLNALGEITA